MALHIEYRRSGGFAGIETAAALPADQLTAEQAALAGRLLADPSLGKPAGPTPPGAADLFEHRLRLVDGDRQHDFRWTDLQLPEAVRPLITALAGRASPT